MLEARHKRLAVQLASQLPENREDALKTLECLHRLVEEFLYTKEEPRGLYLASSGPGIGFTGDDT